MSEYLRDKPFFERIQIWEPEEGIGRDGVYLEVTKAGEVLAIGARIPLTRWPGGYDHGFPWMHLRARSKDRGRTWTLEERNWWEPETRCSAASVVDQTTGDIFLFNCGTWPLQNDQGRPLSESWIIANHGTARQMGARLDMQRSGDGGRTWSKVDLTDQFYTYPGAGLAWFIGGGIQLQRGAHAGRLIVPARYFARELKKVDPGEHNILYFHEALGSVYDDGYGQIAQVLDQEAHNAVIYSDDHGETWEWGGSSQGYTGEACIVELSDGSVYMNNRNYDPRSLGYRSWCISRDGGETFTEFGVDPTLIESRCHAALARFSDSILFANPAVFEGENQLQTRVLGRAARRNMTVRLSYDDGKSWPVSRCIDEEAAYPSMVVLDDGTILCAFASKVCRFNMAWLEQGEANGTLPPPSVAEIRKGKSPSPLSHVTREGIHLHRNAEEFPAIKPGVFARLRNGDILSYAGRPGKLYVSGDAGQSWTERQIFDTESGIEANYSGALIEATDGTVILGFQNLAERLWTWDDQLRDAPGALCPTYAIRSLDGGKTWQDLQKLHDEHTGAIRDVLVTTGGRIVFTSMKMLNNPGRHTVMTYWSDDCGSTWHSSNLIDLGGNGHHDGATEGTIVELNDGRLLLYIRTNWGHFWRALSNDGGERWHPYGPTPDIDSSSAPGILKRLASGRIVLVWNRRFPEGRDDYRLQGGDGIWSATTASNHREELSIAFSEDECESWSAPIVVARKPDGRIAYPYVFDPEPGLLWITAHGGDLRIQLREEYFLA